MEVKISVGDFEVVASGSIVGVANTPFQIKIESLIYDFNFFDDKENPKTRIDTKREGQNKQLIKLINFPTTGNTGITNPWKIGNIKGKNLYLTFVVSSVAPQAGRVLHYTFSIDNKTPNK
jgi:hypothetical protein